MRSPRLWLWAIVALPLNDPALWRQVSFTGIRPNTVAFLQEGLQIHVRSSASPLLHALAEPVAVTGTEMEGTLSKVTAKGSAKKDSPLRVGFVLEGSKRLSWWENFFAPRWILEISSVAETQGGFSHIHFLVFDFDDGRTAPETGKYTSEEPAISLTSGAAFSFSRTLSFPQNVLWVWVQADGDDSGREFSVTLSKLILKQD